MTENEAIEYFYKRIESGNIKNDTEQLAYEGAISVLEEIQKYQALGTAEELREAMKKQRAKKYKIIEPCKSVSYYSCPECDGLLSANQEYCEFCGQLIDWSE